jgi:hypothetical protein
MQRSNSGSIPSAQGPWRDDGWGQAPQQRRGPSGPLNPGASTGRTNASYPLSSGGPTRSGGLSPSGDPGRRSGGLGGQDQRGRSGWDDDLPWQGQGNTRTSRNLSSSLGRPGQGGRGQSGQWGSAQRGWDDEEDEWGMRQQRTPSGKQMAGGRAAQGGRNQAAARKGTTVRGDWVIETDTKYKAPGSSLRVRLLLALLAAVIVLGAAIYFVPGAKNRLLSFLPGSKSSSAPAGAAGAASLTLQVNAPSAQVTLDGKAYTTTAGQAAPFSSVAIPGLAAGNHSITIHANNFTDFTGQLQMPASDTTMTAWLAPSPDQLTALGTQLSKPATQPDPGVAGDHYSATGVAAGKITISISYTLSGLNPSPFTGQLVQGADTKTVPFKPATLTLTPVITFKDAAGTQLAQYKPQALAASKFALQVPLTFDAKGAPQFGAPTITLPSNVTVNFSGPAKSDYTLYYALAALVANSTKPLSFTCVGAVDNKKFNPEDGLQIFEAGGAHYFYRWGLFWATNPAAQTLTPNAPHALPGSNEFNDANTAHANGSCGA